MLQTDEHDVTSEQGHERIRQYADAVFAITSRLVATGAALTLPGQRATVSAGSEVEPQHHTIQHDQ